jgi:AcrR family transcriptional regulator
VQKKEKSTLTAADWERAAMEMIAEKGVAALAVEPLAKRMGITKGSFYWHFTSRKMLLKQALQRWEEHDAKNVSTALGAIDKPRDRLISFFRAISHERFTHGVFSSLCAASDHAQVEPVLERVAETRMKHVAHAFEELGFETEEARHRARLVYSVYLGFLQLQRQDQTPSISSQEFEAYVEHVITTLIPA